MNKQIYVNLPVKNLERTKEFFSSLGFRRFPGKIYHWRGADGMRCKGAAEVREERRVAGHTSNEQRCSAPVCAAKMVNLPRKSP